MKTEKFKVYDPYNLSNKDYHLTSFIESDDNKKGSYSKYLILCEFLADYGIYISMSTHIFDLNKQKTSTAVRACILDKDIPLENIGIIEQMYGFDNSLVHIALDLNDERWFSFWFNTNDKSCELEKMVFGEIRWSKKYNNFEEMMIDVRSKKSIDELSVVESEA